jgi:signal transduction histidine kinase
MSAPANVIPLPSRALPAPAGDELLEAVAAAEDLRGALAEVIARLRETQGLAGAEWWRPAGAGQALSLALSAGQTAGARTAVPLGPAGTLVLAGEGAAGLGATIARLRPALRRRWSEEGLAAHAARLARRAEALEDFAALLAHDVRAALLGALRGGREREGLARALDLVDSVLEAARAEGAPAGARAPAAECLGQALGDLGDVPAQVKSTASGDFPLPPAALRLLLRHLMANALAAGAGRIHVSALALGERRALVVDDDGVGLGAPEGYAAGATLGLALCRRLLARLGGRLELTPRAGGGTRAMIVAGGAGG